MKLRGQATRTCVERDGQIQQGVDKHTKGMLAYIYAYDDFMKEMSRDPRFVLMYGGYGK